jgi:hypothetical protein
MVCVLPPPNGSPISYNQARELAYDVRLWHGEFANTGDWSQSNDAGEQDVEYLTWGLIDLLSDPGAVGRLIDSGACVRERVKTAMTPSQGSVSDRADQVAQVIKGIISG